MEIGAYICFMKTSKLQKVIASCMTLSQLASASRYAALHVKEYGLSIEYLIALLDMRSKAEELTGAVLKNAIDYKDYACHLFAAGKIDDMNDFICFANNELDKIEEYLVSL